MTQWSNEHIIAYLDGTLDLVRGRALHRDRQMDPELDAYIRSMEVEMTRIAQDAEQMLADPPAFTFKKPDTGGGFMRPMAIAASIATVFAGGFVSAWLLRGDGGPPTKWVEAVAEYQMLYSGDTLTLLEKTEDQRAREVAAIGRKLDIILAHSDLQVEGLTLQRSQYLTFKGQPLVQFAYLDANKNPVAFCIIKRKAKKDQPPTSRKVHGQPAIIWSKGNYGYVVIGKSPPATVKEAAEKLKARLEKIGT